MSITLIYFDINRTIIATDEASGKGTPEILASSLADHTFANWSETSPYTDYWHYVQASYPESDRRERAAILASFPTKILPNWRDPFTDRPHPEVAKIQALYNKASRLMEGQFFVPAFSHLIRRCKEEGKPIRIILRTFGTDLPTLIPRYKETFGREMKMVGEFKEHTLHADRSVYDTAEKVDQLFRSLPNDGAVQDDWKFWNQRGENRSAGKLFPIGENPSWFFDDNITGKERDIVRIFDIRSDRELPSHPRAIRADLIAAITDRNYYYDQIFSSHTSSY